MERNEGSKPRRLFNEIKDRLRGPVSQRMDEEASAYESYSEDIALVGMHGSIFPYPQANIENVQDSSITSYSIEPTIASAFAMGGVVRKLQLGKEISFVGFDVKLTPEALHDSDRPDTTTTSHFQDPSEVRK
ncbi:MAG TPA: hypothetical protein PLD54_04725 [Candidatus Levybacteria bacterium]|nr:hypothetical protein [Candidatus Levybacteria bacterium]